MMISALFFFTAGLVVLILGADLLVRGAQRLAASFGVSPLVIGLTIVAIGTASPEIAVSLNAAASGQGDLTLGNILGSNIFNILFILGVTALVAPIRIAEQLIRKDTPIMVGISALALALAFNGQLSRLDGALLAVLLAAYLYFALRESRKESKQVQDEYAQEFSEKEPRTTKTITLNIALIVAGLGLLVLGSNWLVDSAVQIAKALGVSELLIGLTIVAVGTSLPEVATSVVAALKRESDVAVGNVVGSNIFNLLGVLGLSALLSPKPIFVAERVLHFDFIAMVFVALVTMPIFAVDHRVTRFEGALLLVYYLLYVGRAVIEATQPALASAYDRFLLAFAPITFIALTATVFRAAMKKNASP